MRRFIYQSGTSDKYWEIELLENSYRVHYGKTGTDGTEKIKTFRDNEKAKDKYDKVISSKLNKGYTEELSTQDQTQVQKNISVPESEIKLETGIKKKIIKKAAKNKTDLSNPFGLSSYYLNYPAWIEYPVLQTKECKSYDIEKLGKKLQYSYFYDEPMDEVLIKKLNFPSILSPKEAAKILNKSSYTFEDIDMTDRSAVEKELSDEVAIYVSGAILLYYVFGIDIFMEWILKTSIKWSQTIQKDLASALRFIIPYLSVEKRQDLKQKVQNVLDSQIKTNSCSVGVIYSATALKINMLPLADALLSSQVSFEQNPVAGDIIAEIFRSLPSKELVLEYINKINVIEKDRISISHVNMWLSCAGNAVLEPLAKRIQKLNDKSHAKESAKTFFKLKDSEIAVVMFILSKNSKIASEALKWLDDNRSSTAIGLTKYFCRNIETERKNDLLNILRRLSSQDYKQEILQAIEYESEEFKQIVTSEVLEYDGAFSNELNDESTPEWLSTALNSYKPLNSAGVSSFQLPELSIKEGSFTQNQKSQLLNYLKIQDVLDSSPFDFQMKEHISQNQLDTFVWKLFTLWLEQGAPSKEKWMMMSLGHLGGDAIAFKLEPLIRKWPGESQHHRAVSGLTVLEAIGSDTALMLINGIAQKVKYQGIKKNARSVMSSIAKKRGLSAEALADRIIPNCGLDPHGTKNFDYGSRTFKVLLDKNLKPVVKNDAGKVLANLPKPGKKDDSELAEKCLADWKLMKKSIRDTAKIQALRFENAMITHRSWTYNEFKIFFIEHPLMRHISTRVIWGALDEAGKLCTTFRISEELELLDVTDEEFAPDSQSLIIVVHPLELSEEERTAWGQVLSDYEIVSPFPQIGRSVYALEPTEITKNCLSRFNGVTFSAPTLVFGLDKIGWIRGAPMDAGCFDEYSRYFSFADITVVVSYNGNVCMGYIEDDEDLTIEGVYFFKGNRDPDGYFDYEREKKHLVRLNGVSPIIISEVINDLTVLSAKSK